MTTMTRSLIGASSAQVTNWSAINWRAVETHVQRLQMRIAKAIKAGRYNRVKALQWLLTHSFYAKLMAVKRVTQNKGKNTPGVDRIIWKTNKQKMQAVQALRRKGYSPKPLRRIYIPKKKRKTKAAWNPYHGRSKPAGTPPASFGANGRNPS